MSLYGKTQYWEDRYSRNSEPFDWYQRFYAIRQQIISAIPVKQQSKILIPGCGVSRLAEQLVEEGYSDITNIDASVTCTKNMTQKYKEKTQKIKFQCMDVKHLAYGNQSFDGIIDKALLDCIMCSENANQNAYKMLCEMSRVLKKNGSYILLSYECPSRRLWLLQKGQFNWKVNYYKISKPISSASSYSVFQQGEQGSYHYLYVCKKE